MVSFIIIFKNNFKRERSKLKIYWNWGCHSSTLTYERIAYFIYFFVCCFFLRRLIHYFIVFFVCVCLFLIIFMNIFIIFFFCEIFPMRINSNGARFRWDSTQELLWQRDLVDVTVIMGKGKRGGAEHLIHRHQLRTRLRGGRRGRGGGQGTELKWIKSNNAERGGGGGGGSIQDYRRGRGYSN